ncbi:hypothetical protein, partial [Kitasatospora herbaricolor]|uniref:hypothetical protein n=1 Tax=Kitasatospora herbaricolor TaxID=68217 RepID=UPI0036DA6854
MLALSAAARLLQVTVDHQMPTELLSIAHVRMPKCPPAASVAGGRASGTSSGSAESGEEGVFDEGDEGA